MAVVEILPYQSLPSCASKATPFIRQCHCDIMCCREEVQFGRGLNMKLHFENVKGRKYEATQI